MAFHVGIGSWADDAYVGVLYPETLPKKERLRGYGLRFSHVEVNSSYYATPRLPAVRSWVADTPPGFTFSIKLHRAFSQSPAKTAEKGELVDRLFAGIAPLLETKRLAAFLLVLPPTFRPLKRSLQELDTLQDKLAPHPLAVELRDAAWVAGEQRHATLKHFRDRKLVWVAVDMPVIKGSSLMPWVPEVTHPDIAYVRLHGRNPKYLEAGSAAEGHAHAYSSRELSTVATRVRRLAADATQTFVIANNHAQDFAPKAALSLKQRLES